MSKWRKHVTAGGYVDPPEDGQQIVQAVGSRGSNLIEVSALRSQHPLLSVHARLLRRSACKAPPPRGCAVVPLIIIRVSFGKYLSIERRTPPVHEHILF